MKYFVYRHHDVNDVVLYVGVTANMKQRQLTHAKNSQWAARINYIAFDGYDAKDPAYLAEIMAIRHYHPLFNRANVLKPLKTIPAKVHFDYGKLSKWIVANPDASFMDVPAYVVIPTKSEAIDC